MSEPLFEVPGSARADPVARADSTTGVELLAIFREATAEIEAIIEACGVYVEQAKGHGVTVTTSICDER